MERGLEGFAEGLRFIEEKLRSSTSVEDPLLQGLRDSIDYTLHSGGKRIRPLFCLMVGELFGVPPARLTSVACAVEMIHTASLIMDDLPHMDDARQRRGQPANHLVFGQDVASLASVGLLTRAFEVVLADPGIADEQKVRVLRELAGVVGLAGMVGGQYVDLKHPRGGLDARALAEIHARKTALLFVASGTAAAIVGGAGEAERAAVEAYARHLGMAFQVLDDLLDSTGEAGEAGKTLRRDPFNMVDACGPERARQLVAEMTGRALAALEIFGERAGNLVALAGLLLRRRG